MNRRERREQEHRNNKLKAERQAMLDAALQLAGQAANDPHGPRPTDEQLNQAIDEALIAHRATGPRTPEGKERSSQNSFKHGLTCSFSGFKLLPGENVREFTSLVFEVRQQFHPRTTSEIAKVEDMARSWWMMRRAQALLTGAVSDGDERMIALYTRYEAAQCRGYQMAYKAFKDMRDARLLQDDLNDDKPIAEPGIFVSAPTYSNSAAKPQAEPEEAPPDRQAA